MFLVYKAPSLLVTCVIIAQTIRLDTTSLVVIISQEQQPLVLPMYLLQLALHHNQLQVTALIVLSLHAKEYKYPISHWQWLNIVLKSKDITKLIQKLYL